MLNLPLTQSLAPARRTLPLPRCSGYHRRSRREGLTLVEVLVVLVIMVALLGLIGPRVLGSQHKADIKTATIDIGNLSSGLQLFVVDNKTFPSTEDGLDALMNPPTDEQRRLNWDGPYMDAEELPVDPWGNAYRYVYPPEHGKRDFPNIWSPGKDGQDNTEDDIVNWKESSPDNERGATSNDDRNN